MRATLVQGRWLLDYFNLDGLQPAEGPMLPEELVAAVFPTLSIQQAGYVKHDNWRHVIDTSAPNISTHVPAGILGGAGPPVGHVNLIKHLAVTVGGGVPAGGTTGHYSLERTTPFLGQFQVSEEVAVASTSGPWCRGLIQYPDVYLRLQLNQAIGIGVTISIIAEYMTVPIQHPVIPLD